MLKKLLLILLLMAYTGSTIGATVSFHYCMGKLAATTLGQPKKDKCPKCGMKEKKAKKKSCCDNKELQLKLKAEHKTVENQSLKFIPETDIDFTNRFLVFNQSILADTNAVKSYSPNSPPTLNKYKLHVLYSVFLI